MDMVRSIAAMVGLLFVAAAPARADAACSEGAYEGSDTCHRSSVLRGGSVLNRTFCEDTEDWASFNACAGRTYVLTTENLQPNADTVLELFAADCTTLLATNDDGGAGGGSRIVWSAPSSGNYHVRVRQKDGSAGELRGYDLHLAGETGSCGTWSRRYTLPSDARVESALLTSNGGTLLVYTYSATPPFDREPAIVKLDAAGNVSWRIRIGAQGHTVLGAVQTSDGGFILATYAGYLCAWKLTSNGGLTWNYTYQPSRPGSAAGESVLRPTSDGGAILSGTWNGWTPEGYIPDVLVLRIGGTGTLLWSRSIDGTPPAAPEFEDGPIACDETADGGFMVAGWTAADTSCLIATWIALLSKTGELVQRKQLGECFWLTMAGAHGVGFLYAQPGLVGKLDKNLSAVWTRSLSGLSLNRIAGTSDGGMLVAGPMESSPDIWAGKLAADGDVVWQKRYVQPGQNQDVKFVGETLDGGARLLVVQDSFPPQIVVLQTDEGGTIRSCAPWQDSGELVSTAARDPEPTDLGLHFAPPPLAPGWSFPAQVSQAPALTRTNECQCNFPFYTGTLKLDRVAGSTRVYWNSTGSIRYDVVRGSLGVLEATGGDFAAALDAVPGGPCLANDTTALQVVDGSASPSPGDGYFYVLRPVNQACLLGGSYDSWSASQVAGRDGGIEAATSTCP